MIKCPTCDIEYSPSFARCPKCRRYPTPRFERARYVAQTASERISDCEDPEIVRHYLQDNGFSEKEADAIVQKGKRGLRSENRSHGRHQFAAGLAMLFAGGLILLLVGGAAFTEGGFVAGMHSGKGVMFLLFALLVGGLVATLFGAYAVLTGR